MREVAVELALGASRAASHQVAPDGEPGSGPLLVDGLLDGSRRCLGSHDVLFHRRDNDFPDLSEVSVEMFPLQAFRIIVVVARHRVSELGVCSHAFEPRVRTQKRSGSPETSNYGVSFGVATVSRT